MGNTVGQLSHDLGHGLPPASLRSAIESVGHVGVCGWVEGRGFWDSQNAVHASERPIKQVNFANMGIYALPFAQNMGACTACKIQFMFSFARREMTTLVLKQLS